MRISPTFFKPEIKIKLDHLHKARNNSTHIGLQRISRHQRVGITFTKFKIWEKEYGDQTIQKLKERYTNGLIIIFENNDYFKDSDSKFYVELKERLGSNNLVSSIIGIEDFDSFKTYFSEIKNMKLTPLKKLRKVNSGNDVWEGEYYVNVRGGRQKSIVIPAKRVDLVNYDYDFCPEDELEKTINFLTYLMTFSINGETAFISEESKNQFDQVIINIDFENTIANPKNLKKKGILNSDNELICQLCLGTLNIKNFFDSGEATLNEVEIMHLIPLKANLDSLDLKHTVENICWGHKICNRLQGEDSLADVKEKVVQIALGTGKVKLE